MIRNKVFYSLSANDTQLITKSNQITLNPEEANSKQPNIPSFQPLQYNTYSITANLGQQLQKKMNPQENANIRYIEPQITYIEKDYKSDYMLPSANNTYAFNG